MEEKDKNFHDQATSCFINLGALGIPKVKQTQRKSADLVVELSPMNLDFINHNTTFTPV